MSADPIRVTLERWHQHLAGNLSGGLDALLHPDCVFLSPIVFTPQRGREVTKLYLGAAGATLVGGANSGEDIKVDGASPFRYVKEIAEGHHAMLEFETTMHDGTRDVAVNGVDILTCDDDGMIVEFKVMVRPLQAVNLVHAQMKAQLEAVRAGD
jgi:hypothetical protein